MKEFSDFIEDMNLIDLQLQDATYTWFKGYNQEIASRIDRILISEEFDDSFSNLKQFPLQRLISDHIPVALQRGKPDYILACKLKALKSKLKIWSRSESGNLGSQRRSLLGQMAQLDAVLEERVSTEEESVKKETLLVEYEELIKNEEITCRQKSRSFWLKEGDKNTKFFHKMANAHKRYNNIDQLVIQEETIEEPARIEEEIIDFYQKLHTENTYWRPACNFTNCPIITEEETEVLQGRFKESERMKGVIEKLVDSQQMAFIKGRQIMDAVLVARCCPGC
ncbi:uncharacterized protein LOC132630925 [Lycium barbarum]|uniref:uncharacterized protein LOC132630925 n=1 Tax=Lycium barbarum TaxID=112863 RepID=UPI00293F602F|nr:uncharacterized protein LOC132630925 [Lycium barbarum]